MEQDGRGGLRGGERVKGKGRGTGDCRKVSMLGHACPNELIACARARDAQRGKEKAVIDRKSEWERVSEAERYKTPNTFSIMSPTRLAGHGSDSTLRQHSNQITRQTELFNCCKCVTLLLPPFECPLLVPPLPAPWQSLARQI